VSARAIARGAVVSDATLLRRGRGPLVDDRVATGPRRDRGLASPVHCTEVEASTGSTPPPTTMERVMKKLVSISVCSSLVLGIGCAEAPNDRGDDDDDPGTTSVYLASSVVRASNGAACGAAASPANTADQADCLTIESTWGGAGATPENAENAARSLVYTGIDATTDAVLVGREKAFAKGFPDAGGRPVAAVYGAHGEPGWIQGLPDNAGAQGQGSILRVGFGGARGIPLLALSTCWAGNTGEHATRRQLTQNPRTYLNNIAPASFVSTYFSIPSDNIVACKNGTVRPTESELFCTQEKRQLPGEAQARVRGDATVIKGDGTARGTATAGRDYVFTMQTKTDTVPSRSFTAVNIPLRRVDEADYPADSPWKQEPRSCPENMGCRIQDKYPMFTTFPMQVPAGGPSSFYLSGQFLTASIIIETPSGARAVAEQRHRQRRRSLRPVPVHPHRPRPLQGVGHRPRRPRERPPRRRLPLRVLPGHLVSRRAAARRRPRRRPRRRQRQPRRRRPARRPAGDRSAGDRPAGDRPAGDRPARPRSARPRVARDRPAGPRAESTSTSRPAVMVR
jgi:hypothetical protein